MARAAAACSSRHSGSSWRQIPVFAPSAACRGVVFESGLSNARESRNAYQYSSFGVPGPDLRRGLSEDVVIAPYATGLAAMIDPTAEIQKLPAPCGRGPAAPTASTRRSTTPRPGSPEVAQVAVIRAYMAHHQAWWFRRDRKRRSTTGAMRRALPCRAHRPGHELLLQRTDAA